MEVRSKYFVYFLHN